MIQHIGGDYTKPGSDVFLNHNFVLPRLNSIFCLYFYLGHCHLFVGDLSSFSLIIT
jgi:hypothetical protein